MQHPTCTGLRIRSVSDAHVIFHAVSLNLLPIVARRLDATERRAIHAGCVCVWEERNACGESSSTGIERWTDGRRWGPSRVRDEFLYYQEKLPEEFGPDELSSILCGGRLVKQTYSVYVENPSCRRKWHLVAYFTPETLDHLLTIDDFPALVAIRDIVPPGVYTTARAARNRGRGDSQPAVFSLHPTPVASSLHSNAPETRMHARPRPTRERALRPAFGPVSIPKTAEFDFEPPLSSGSSTASSSDSHGSPRTSLPTLKPPPWMPPPEPPLRAPSRGGIDLAPLVYMQKKPWPPRDLVDDDVLRLFDSPL